MLQKSSSKKFYVSDVRGQTLYSCNVVTLVEKILGFLFYRWLTIMIINERDSKVSNQHLYPETYLLVFHRKVVREI